MKNGGIDFMEEKIMMEFDPTTTPKKSITTHIIKRGVEYMEA